MQKNIKKERLWLWLMLSVGIHMFLVFIFIDIEYDKLPESLVTDLVMTDSAIQQQLTALAQQQPSPAQQPEQQAQQDDSELQFMLNMKDNSSFGASVIFKELPTLAQADTQEPESLEPPQESTEQEESAQRTDEPQETHDEQPEGKAEPLQQIAEQLQTPPVDIAALNKQALEHIQHQIAKKKKKKKKKKGVTTLAGSDSQTGSPITHNLTLTKLAEGFINYVHERRDDIVDINTLDMKYVAYMQKIGWYLQNSFHLYNRPITLDYDVRTQTTLHLEIDESGALVETRLSPQTGARPIDDNLLNVARNAGPFPPLPKHLNRKTLKIKLPIAVSAARGTHSYYFTFRG